MTDWPDFYDERRKEVGLRPANERTRDDLERLAEEVSPEEVRAVVATLVGSELQGFEYGHPQPGRAHKKLRKVRRERAVAESERRRLAYERRK